MSRDTRTRRRVLAAFGSAATIGLAGCSFTGGSDQGGSPEPETADSPTGTTSDATPSPTAEAMTAPPSYEACMEPINCLSFNEPPGTWVANDGIYCDMGVALGLADRLGGIGSPRRYYTGYYDELPGVSLDKADYPALSRGTRMPKEPFYAVDADVHLIDPVWLMNTFGWTEADVEEIATNVGPFFGNYIREQHDGWHTYRYYSLSEVFGKVASLFGRRSRYEQWESVRTDLDDEIRSRLPDEKVELLLLRPQGIPPRSFFPQHIDDSVSDLQWQVVEVEDALKGTGIPQWGTRIDYETIARIDPEVIVMETQFADDFVLDESFNDFVLGHMSDHPVARNVTAVENDRVHAGGINYQGPLVSLFQTEQAAQIAYPDEFGGEELFDRDRVARIVTNDG
jgi:ABC-type Fe3+-hydroxamate transport system, periplasmic component